MKICTVPTPDSNPSAGHPDVLHVPDGFGGESIPYWMAFTPYPPLERENPCVLASRDGITWFLPTGAANPVVPRAEVLVQGFGGNSDTDLIKVGSELWLYYRPIYGSGGEAIYRKRSLNGKDWSTAEVVIPATYGQAEKYVSPSVVQAADGSFLMWTHDVSSSPYKIRRQTSTDGLTWAAPVDCTLPSGCSTPWHSDVVRQGERYVALVNDSNRLYFLISDDEGLTWKVDPLRLPVMPLSGGNADLNGFYRSSFLIEADGSFRVWQTLLNTAATPNGSIFHANAVWSIGFQRLWAGGDHSIFLPAQSFSASLGSPTLVLRNSRFSAWSFSNTQSQGVARTVVLPDDWQRLRISLFWANLAASSGNVRWTCSRLAVADGDVAGSSGDSTEGFGSPVGSDGVAAPTTADLLKETVLVHSARLLPYGSLTHLRVNRTVGGGDTLPNNALLYGVLLERSG